MSRHLAALSLLTLSGCANLRSAFEGLDPSFETVAGLATAVAEVKAELDIVNEQTAGGDINNAWLMGTIITVAMVLSPVAVAVSTRLRSLERMVRNGGGK